MPSSKTVIEALSATEFLPVCYSVRNDELKRFVLSREPDEDGEYGAPKPLSFAEAERYAWCHDNSCPNDLYPCWAKFKWDYTTGYWKGPEETMDTENLGG